MLQEHRISKLCEQLREQSTWLKTADEWPRRQLELCAKYDVFQWFIAKQWHGLEWSADQIVEGYIQLAAACLTTTFVISQQTGACKRIAASANSDIKDKLLPDVATGNVFATLGISHLTTSHQHQGKPALAASRNQSGWLLTGFVPWVTGAAMADHIVIGAETKSGQQILFAMPATLDGVTVQPGYPTIALSSSQTARIELNNVEVSDEFVLDGPEKQVLKPGIGSTTGGLQTSALAIGLSTAATRFVVEQSASRPNLIANAKGLEAELAELKSNILGLAVGNSVCSNEQLRTAANSFALRATQSALIAAKGAGFVEGHPVGRWCREALFFLVWSCPQGVSDANLCEFAGISI